MIMYPNHQRVELIKRLTDEINILRELVRVIRANKISKLLNR